MIIWLKWRYIEAYILDGEFYDQFYFISRIKLTTTKNNMLYILSLQ